MKLLLVHRYIRPDTPGYAHMLYIIGQHLADCGHDVTIFSAQPGYNDAYDGPKLPRREFVDGMTVIRTPLFPEKKKSSLRRSINFLIFSISLWWHSVIRVRAYDVMTVTTFPPTLMGFVARVIGRFRKTQYVYHCMDLYPEIAEASGLMKRPWFKKLAAGIDRRNCEQARAVIVLSGDMLETVRERGVRIDNVHVINNFIIDEFEPSTAPPEQLVNCDEKFRVLFAGNIGRFQSLDTIVDAAHRLSDHSEIGFLFVGSGVMVEPLKQQSGDLLNRTVRFHDYLPIQEVMPVINQSHLGVVSLTPDVIRFAYPSKTMSYLEAGCKLLCLVEPDCELASLVTKNSLGAVCDASDPAAVACEIEKQYRQWQAGDFDRSDVQRVGRSHFSQKVILKKMAALFADGAAFPAGSKNSG